MTSFWPANPNPGDDLGWDRRPRYQLRMRFQALLLLATCLTACGDAPPAPAGVPVGPPRAAAESADSAGEADSSAVVLVAPGALVEPELPLAPDPETSAASVEQPPGPTPLVSTPQPPPQPATRERGARKRASGLTREQELWNLRNPKKKRRGARGGKKAASTEDPRR